MENVFPIENVFPTKNGKYSSQPYVSLLRGYLFFCCCPHHLGYFGHKKSLGPKLQHFPRLDALVFLCGVLGTELSFFVSEFSNLEIRIEDRCQRLDSPQTSHTENESQRLNERVEPQTHKILRRYVYLEDFFWNARGLFVGQMCCSNLFLFMVRNGSKWYKPRSDVAIC